MSESAASAELAELAELVAHLRSNGNLRSDGVEAAFLAVPRHRFLPDEPVDRAYRDEAIVTKTLDGRPVSSCSQPSIIAAMLEQLDVQPGHRILEIGAGTGYNAALLAHLAGPSGSVVTMDIDEDIFERASANLDAVGTSGVEVVLGDGVLGHPDGAPFDRIVLTVGAADIAPAWHEQLAPGGRLLLPLSLGGAQQCVAFDDRGGWMESVSSCDCGFMRLRGESGEREVFIRHETVSVSTYADIDESAVRAALGREAGRLPVDVKVISGQNWSGLNLWLNVRAPGYCSVYSVWRRGADPPMPVTMRSPQGMRESGWSPGSFDGSTLAVVGRTGDELVVTAVGEDLGHAARIVELIRRWDAVGRPSSRSLHIRAYPTGYPAPEVGDDEAVFTRQATTFVVGWG